MSASTQPAAPDDANASRSRVVEPDDIGQRRYLTVLFADLTDSTRLGDVMEAEHYAAMLHALRRLCREIIPKHGGCVARLQGDGALAIFGYPQSMEDDGRRATEAALELHAAVTRIAVEGDPLVVGRLSMHSGIHAGLVYVADGDVERGRVEVLGNVPNVAARLSDLADADEIYVSEETLGPESRFFATSARRVVNVKGYAPPLAVFRILGRAQVQRRFDASFLRGSAPFAGREIERRTLRDALQQVLSGTPGCIAISGGPGLGKTRLLEELLHDALEANCMTLRGYCEGYLGAEPLQPFLQMLRTLRAARVDARTDTEEPAGSLLRAAFGKSIDAIRSVFDSLAASRPLLLVLDDWQWADSVSQQVLDAILSLKRPILVLLATRHIGADGAEPAHARTLALAPLDSGDAARTMAYLLPEADPFVIAKIHRYSGGNPLFIEELCHAARAEGGSRPIEDIHGGSAWLNALVESRVSRLPPLLAEIVRAAAVIGTVFPASLLERITGHGEHDPLLRELARQDWIFPAESQGMLRFKHGITRDVIYAGLGLHHRQVMHRRIAAALNEAGQLAGGEDVLERLAYHCAAGEMPVEAARHAELAGDKAMAAFALDRARAQFSAALKALDGMPLAAREDQLQWCAVAQKLGMACVFDPLALANGVAIFERGVALARQSGSTEVLARAHYWLGYICYAKGRAREATDHCKTALGLAEQLGDGRLAAQVRATLGQTLASAGDYDAALLLLDTAIDSKRARAKPGGSVAVGSAYALACKGSVLGDRGLFDDADACFAQALELLGDTVHQVASSVRNWVSAVYQWQGRWEEAEAMAAGSVRIAEHVKSRQLLAMSRALWGYANWVVSQRPEALLIVHDATAWIEARKGALVTSLNYGWLVDGAVSLGRVDEARRHAARLFIRARQHDRIGEAMGCRALARAAAAAKDEVRVEHYLGLALRSAQVRHSPHEQAKTQLCRAGIEIERGRPREAHAPLDAACEAFAQMRMSWHLQQAQALRLRL